MNFDGINSNPKWIYIDFHQKKKTFSFVFKNVVICRHMRFSESVWIAPLIITRNKDRDEKRPSKIQEWSVWVHSERNLTKWSRGATNPQSRPTLHLPNRLVFWLPRQTSSYLSASHTVRQSSNTQKSQDLGREKEDFRSHSGNRSCLPSKYILGYHDLNGARGGCAPSLSSPQLNSTHHSRPYFQSLGQSNKQFTVGETWNLWFIPYNIQVFLLRLRFGDCIVSLWYILAILLPDYVELSPKQSCEFVLLLNSECYTVLEYVVIPRTHCSFSCASDSPFCLDCCVIVPQNHKYRPSQSCELETSLISQSHHVYKCNLICSMHLYLSFPSDAPLFLGMCLGFQAYSAVELKMDLWVRLINKFETKRRIWV